MVAYGRWSLTGSFTNSNLTDGGTNWDLGSRGGRSGRFHCIVILEQTVNLHRDFFRSYQFIALRSTYYSCVDHTDSNTYKEMLDSKDVTYVFSKTTLVKKKDKFVFVFKCLASDTNIILV